MTGGWFDVLVAGSGPAGSTAALNLAPSRTVLLVERRLAGGPRVGESLAPAARRLLRDMGLWASFLAEGHLPCRGQVSYWGSAEPRERDQLCDLDGQGWHLDRARFDAWLRGAARQRGAVLACPAAVVGVERAAIGWRVTLEGGGERRTIGARFLIDATGRSRAVARRLGVRRTSADRLVSVWMHVEEGSSGRHAGLTLVSAEPDGWWYTAPLPARRRVLAFHTDADLLAAHGTSDRRSLLRRACQVRGLSDALASASFAPDAPWGTAAARSSALDLAAGDGWLAAGDAALSFDPLAAQGLLHALYTGLAAAEATDRYLAAQAAPAPGPVGSLALDGYQQALQRIRRAYEEHLRGYYGDERRWPGSTFWQRRHAR